MSKKIIDHKAIDLTEDEWNLYQSIARSYDRPNFKGESLFQDLFETDEDGIIIFLKPPSHRYVSWEVFMFLMSIQSHQHLRRMQAQLDSAIRVGEEKINLAIKNLSKK